ncbi:biotin synthase [Selenomonas sp. GACV-9]|uniref:biotin synthase BioB n=1 Tax=Selenomonas sp. GACV-9 TaxID=3158782 RepID=UPI0008F3755B|nr:biotin synthase [Selenomonas ruminantium]
MKITAIDKLTDKIIAGLRIRRGDDVSYLLTAPLEELQVGARRLQDYFCGNHIDLCTIINGRSGRCGENCKYCAQAACHHTGIDEYPFLPKEEIIQNAKANQDAGANRFAIVTSGRALAGADFDKAIDTYKAMHDKLTIGLCASHGLLTREQFKRLRAAGVTSYHHNIETSRRFFPQICTSHTYQDRIDTIKIAQEEGFCVCSGGIIGMGETWEDRFDMAISLQELGIESIPINSLMAIPGTGLAQQPALPAADILRTIAIFRFINPTANIRLAAGRKLLPQNGATAFRAGASASITGNMLTTSGTTIKEDMELLHTLGLTNHNDDSTISCSTCGTH